jgi:hypothetical protein
MPKKENKKFFINKKALIMRIGVFVLAVIIFSFWIINLKNTFNFFGQANNSNDLDKLKEIINEPISGFDDSQEEVVLPDSDSERLKQEAEELLGNIMERADKKDSSSKAINCPEWVNCMPTIGEAPSCEIPPGCEGITQKVY